MVYLKNYSVILLLLTTLPLLATARNDDWRLVWSDEFNTEGRYPVVTIGVKNGNL